MVNKITTKSIKVTITSKSNLISSEQKALNNMKEVVDLIYGIKGLFAHILGWLLDDKPS